MSDVPTFSVVVPTRGRPAQLHRCLAALARLDYPRDRYEVVVVVDGADDDGEPGRPAGLALRIVRQPHQGPARARNRGAEAATGSLLAFTDDDCMPDPAWLRRLAARLREDPGALVGGLTRVAPHASIYSSASQLVVDALYAYHGGEGEQGGFFTTNNMALATSAFHELGGFDGSFPFAAGEDHEFSDRWRQRGGRLVYAPEALVLHAHALRFRTFLRQHFTYGRGTVDLHRARRERGLGRPKFAPGLYWLLLVRLPLRERFPRSLALAALGALTQVAYAAGFLHERRRRRAAARA